MLPMHRERQRKTERDGVRGIERERGNIAGFSVWYVLYVAKSAKM